MFKLSAKQISFLQVVLIILLGALIYSSCSNGNFIWDDLGLIKHNDQLKDWSNLPKIISADFGSGSGADSNFYRPLQVVIQMVGYSWWGAKPFGYHLISILTHILAAVIFYFLLRNIFQNKTFSFLASLLFLSSPVNTEAVCYISGLSDPLGLVFILACLFFYLKFLAIKNTGLYILALLSFILALFSKENALILPLLILLYHYAFGKKIQIKKIIPFFGILIVYCLLRCFILSQAERPVLTFVDLGSRIPIFFAGITEYCRLLLLPVGLHVEYPNQLFSFTDPKVILGYILTCALIILAFMKKKTHPGLFFACAWFFITILPVSNIYPISYAFIMEHYLYLPALGFFIILAGLFCYPAKAGSLRMVLRFSAVGLLIFYSYLTFRQGEYWKEPVAFYKRTIQYAPQSWRFYNELGLEYVARGENLKAEAAYQEALRINPDALGIYFNLRGLYEKTGDQANLLATEKLANQAKDRLIWQSLEAAGQFQAAGRYEQALAAFKKALKLDQNNLIVGLDLADLYVLMGRYNAAVNLFKKILASKPDFALAYNNLAVAYYYLGQYDLAVANCDRAKALGYQVKPRLVNLLKHSSKMKGD